MAAKPFPTQLLLLRNSIHILLSVEIKTSGTLSPQNLPVKNTHIKTNPVRLITSVVQWCSWDIAYKMWSEKNMITTLLNLTARLPVWSVFCVFWSPQRQNLWQNYITSSSKKVWFWFKFRYKAKQCHPAKHCTGHSDTFYLIYDWYSAIVSLNMALLRRPRELNALQLKKTHAN